MIAWARVVGEGPGVLIEDNQEGIRRRDFEGFRGGGRIPMGNSNVAQIHMEKSGKHNIMRQSLMNPLNLLHYWKSTT